MDEEGWDFEARGFLKPTFCLGKRAKVDEMTAVLRIMMATR